MKSPYTRAEIVDILALVVERLDVSDRWEYAAWYYRANKKTRELRENITRRNMGQDQARGRLKVTVGEMLRSKAGLA